MEKVTVTDEEIDVVKLASLCFVRTKQQARVRTDGRSDGRDVQEPRKDVRHEVGSCQKQNAFISSFLAKSCVRKSEIHKLIIVSINLLIQENTTERKS